MILELFSKHLWRHILVMKHSKMDNLSLRDMNFNELDDDALLEIIRWLNFRERWARSRLIELYGIHVYSNKIARCMHTLALT